jgi:hypothetical protein
MRRKILIVLCFLSAVLGYKFFYSAINKIVIQDKCIKQINRYEQGRDFLRKNQNFIKSISNYPEIINIIINSLSEEPKFIDFFITKNKEFIEELKASQWLRKVILFNSKYPFCIRVFIRDYASTIRFLNENANLFNDLMANPDYADYLLLQHADIAESLLNASNFKETNKAIYEKFIVDKYLKDSIK